jgi:hypothetical protein
MEHVSAKLDISERLACRVLGQHRSTQRKAPKMADDEVALTAAIIDWARQYGRYGYRRITPCCGPKAGFATTSGLSGSGAAKG